jgi:hypothetical protein
MRMPNSGRVFSVELMRVNHCRVSGGLFNMIWRSVDIRHALIGHFFEYRGEQVVPGELWSIRCGHRRGLSYIAAMPYN